MCVRARVRACAGCCGRCVEVWDRVLAFVGALRVQVEKGDVRDAGCECISLMVTYPAEGDFALRFPPVDVYMHGPTHVCDLVWSCVSRGGGQRRGDVRSDVGAKARLV